MFSGLVTEFGVQLNMLIMLAIFLVIDIIGMREWIKLAKQQKLLEYDTFKNDII